MKVSEKTMVGGGILRIIGEKKVQILYTDEGIALEECLKRAREAEPDIDQYQTVIVIEEHALEGKVFKYGNHGDFWEEVGETRGYA